MVAILPGGDYVREYLKQHTSAIPDDADCLAAQSGEELLGAIAFTVEGDTARLCAIDSPNSCIADGLIRAALNKARSRGAMTARCALASWFAQLKSLGFTLFEGKEDPLELYADINEALKATCCSGKQRNNEIE